MNKPEIIGSDEEQLNRPVFVSYASADRKEALAVCKAIESRGTKCWISCRDVKPGGNYQEAIVRAIRSARTMVLVFSDAANNSDEIKKELSLASKAHVPVMALRIEDVEPSDAFAYELSTRQWLDAFEGWDRSIDHLVRHIREDSADERAPVLEDSKPRRRAAPARPRSLWLVGVVALVLVLGAGTWWLLRPTASAAHSMVVRLTGFSNPSSDLPPGMPDAIRDEVIAAFNDDGVVGVSTAAAPPSGDGPAYALGGSIRRSGDKIRVIARLTNERSGTTLWSNSYDYDADQLSRVPRHIAVDAGNMLRCGLFAASTYRKALPDPVMADYMQFCANSGYVQFEPGKALDFAHKVVAAAPDFSWGWSAVATAAQGNIYQDPLGSNAPKFRRRAAEAAEKAIALDESNSEAIDLQALLLPATDFVGREALMAKALQARPLACGCEHHLYGMMLQTVGRNRDAVDEYRRSTDVLALDFDSQFGLGDALLMSGRPEEAKTHFDAATDLSSDPLVSESMTLTEVPVTEDYAAALKAVGNPNLHIPESVRTALQAAYQAMITNDSPAKTRAVQLLGALPPESKGRLAVTMLGALGANHEMMQAVAEKLQAHMTWAASWLFLPGTRGVLDDPGFPAFAQRIGMMKYWKATKTRPDICAEKNAPRFCAMI